MGGIAAGLYLAGRREQLRVILQVTGVVWVIITSRAGVGHTILPIRSAVFFKTASSWSGSTGSCFIEQ